MYKFTRLKRGRVYQTTGAFNRVTQYDAAISDYLSSITFDASASVPARNQFPDQSNGCFVKLQDLRYGENPHQSAAFYRYLYPAPDLMFAWNIAKFVKSNSIVFCKDGMT